VLDTTLDPSITPDLVEAAHTGTPIAYELVFAEITKRLAQDDLTDEPHGLVSAPIRTPNEACLEARRIHDENIDVGIGMCLRTVHNYFNVGALWPDATAAAAHSSPFHTLTDPAKFPRGVVAYALNDRHSHVFLSVGGGLCWTTDFKRLGHVDLAPISAMAPWIGGRLAGWGEVLNGVDVWPSPKKPTPKPLTSDEKLHVLRNDIRELEHAGRDWRARRLQLWHDHIKKHGVTS
jgi:hypothetical protein